MRGHTPIKFDTFKGLWRRGDPSSCPLDHFPSCNNIDFDQQGVISRGLFAFAQTIGTKVLSNYVYQTATSVLLMIGDDVGDLYKLDISAGFGGAFTLVVANATGTRYNFITINNRLYINQTSTGTSSYFGNGLYTYDGTTYRTTGCATPAIGTFISNNSGTAGNVDAGLHVFGVVYETNSGFLSKIHPIDGPSAGTVSPGNQQITFTGIPVSGDARVVARRLVSSKVNNTVTFFDVTMVTSYFIPGGRIADNVTTALTVNFTDSQLLEDSSYLNDISDMQTGPGGRALTTYHNRLIMGGDVTNPRRLYVSNPGDYETFNLVDGILDVNPSISVPASAFSQPIGITALQAYRDVLYMFGYSSSFSVVDNGDVPSTWIPITLDESLGSLPDGITTVYQTNSVSIDYLIIASKDGLYAFNGAYVKPEISWKIFDLWKQLEFNQSDATLLYKGKISIVNDIFTNKIYILVGDSGSNYTKRILMGDYRQTSPTDENFYMNIKWSSWTFNANLTPTVLLAINRVDSVQVIVAEYSTTRYLQLDGTSNIKEAVMPAPTFDTAYIRDDDDNILHYAAFRLRLSNDTLINDTVNLSIYNNEDDRHVDVPAIIVKPGTGRDKEVVTNFLAQAGFVRFTANHFFMDRFWVYVKPTYSTLPT